MKNGVYTYSLLTYKHSALLGESLNIGFLAFFSEEKRFIFEYTKSLSRLKSVYSAVSDKTIRHYLKQIESRIDQLNNRIDSFLKVEIEDSLDIFINDYILPSDSSSLQFSRSKKSFQNDIDSSVLIKYLIDTYLIELEKYAPNKEYELSKLFYSKIKNHIGSRINSKYFHKDFKVKRNTGAEFTFSYAWQNGSLNLIKPLNFDLSDANYIARKTNENYGLIVGLEEEAIKNDYRYDFLVGRPKRKKLFKEYDNSIKFLSELNRIRIIEEDQIEDYSSYAAEQIISKLKR